MNKLKLTNKENWGSEKLEFSGLENNGHTSVNCLRKCWGFENDKMKKMLTTSTATSSSLSPCCHLLNQLMSHPVPCAQVLCFCILSPYADVV